jgi:hypothetical protein
MKKLVACLLFALPACSGSIEDPPPTWEQFRAMAIEGEAGQFVIDGDEVYDSEASLAEYYQRYILAPTERDVGESTQPLIVNRVGGRDDKWNTTTAQNLTYCVSRQSFGNLYNQVVTAMARAAAAWEAVANVKFVHVAAADTSCNRQTPVLFNVRLNSSQQYLAYAFFPSFPRAQREVVISTLGFVTDTGAVSLAGVLRHELGHTLGFRHEHIRVAQSSPRCQEGGTIRALTPYDSSSVMHYPHCRGTNRGDLVLTQRDKTGAASLYPGRI